jgi:hypothetical protein
MATVRKVSLAFAAGSLGGLVKSACAWTFGSLGINALLGVKMAPALTPFFIYQHVVWGGLWGLLFLAPARRWGPWLKGLVFSLPMSLIQLFFMFPQAGSGLLGLKMGILTPALVLFFGFIWGWTTAFWLKVTEGGR